MKDIEILPDASGVPTVTLHGDAKAAAEGKSISKVHVSLSHSEVSTSYIVTMIEPLTKLYRPLPSRLHRRRQRNLYSS